MDVPEDGLLMALDLDNTILVDALNFGKGEVVLSAHECSNPEHQKDIILPVLVMIVTDKDEKEHTMLFDMNGGIVAALCEMDIYYQIKNIVEEI